MKKIFTYMTLMATVLLTACSDSEDFALTSGGGSFSYLENKNTISMPLVVHEENWEGNSGLESKSSLAYKYQTGRLRFEWQEGDNVGVYPVKGSGGTPVDPSASTCIPWKIWSVTTTDDKSVGVFDQDDEHISPHKDESYIAVSPYILDDTDYRDIPVTYVGQLQKASAKIGAYMKKSTTSEEEKYVASEVEACSHLSKYDYLVDTERQATEAGGKMRFEMKRLSSIVRFFMKVPANIVFDNLQLYNPTKEFTLTTTLDGSAGEYAAEPTTKSHAMSLKLNEFGFDYTTCTADDDYYYSSTIGWVMVCYMMVAPIDLSETATEESTLYLIGREPHYYANATEYNAAWGTSKTSEQFEALTQEQKMKIYTSREAFNTAKGTSLTDEQYAELSTAQKMSEWTSKAYSATLTKKNLEADVLYQWSSAASAEDPIEFQNISIQEWENGPGFTNEDGTGTADW